MAESIALVVVMVLINLFMLYAIIRTWSKVNEKVEKYFLHNTSAFGPIKEKGEEETVVKEEIKNREAEPASSSVFIEDRSNTVFYQNENFASDYKQVKENMEFSKKEIIQSVIENKEENESFAKVLFKLKEDLDFDTVYELSTLDQSVQLKVLMDSLDTLELNVLNNYLSANGNGFDIVEFIDYVNQLALKEDPTIYVKTGWKNDNFDGLDDSVKTVFDDKITEGVKIIHKDKIYDYSI